MNLLLRAPSSPWRPAVYRVNDGAVSVSMGSYPRTRPLSLRAANSPARSRATVISSTCTLPRCNGDLLYG
eukprot:3016190-Prymnesium_polylepis.1